MVPGSAPTTRRDYPDAGARSRPYGRCMTSTVSAPTRRWWPRVAFVLKVTLVVTGVAALLGALIGDATYTPPCGGDDFICFTRGQTEGIGAATGAMLGAPAGLVGSLVWLAVRAFRNARAR